MSSRSLRFPDAYAFLAGTRPIGYRGPVYVVGGRGERRVTLYAQQCRALNIAAAFNETHDDHAHAGHEVAVIGAGAAGMTAAAALTRSGSNVTVFDQAAAPLHPQRASFTRYLHPRLFHWPESGWDVADAGLPVGDWTADYADTVRERILRDLGGVAIVYCTAAVDVLDAERPLVRLRRLGEYQVEERDFDAVIVATGFPCERPPDHALGGSYWHAVEGLDLFSTEHVRVAGDGDGALTEVLLLFIDRLGHRGVEALARSLPIRNRLRDSDFVAQGQPDANADPPLESRSDKVLEELALLDDERVRVTIYAKDALKGKSFLLNRVLVSHLRWLERAPVDVVPQNLRTDAGRSGVPVIWRVGLLGATPPRRFEIPRLATARVLAQIPAPDPGQAGLLAQTVDALRRPMWTSTFIEDLEPGRAWCAAAPHTIVAACGRVADDVRSEMPMIAATYWTLSELGIPMRLDAARLTRDGLWVSIETVVRCTSIPHAECLTPTVDELPRGVGRDEEGRLWFWLDHPDGHEGSRKAVAALVEPRQALEDWARHKRSASLDGVPAPILRGLADVAVPNGTMQSRLFRAHRRAGPRETDHAIAVRLRAARIPDGSTGRAETASHVRRAMLDIAEVLSESEGSRYFRPDDLWLLLGAAGSRLRTVASENRPLTVSTNFLSRIWAHRVLRIVERMPWVPDWFRPVERVAHRASDVGDRELRGLVEEVTLATARAKTAEAMRRAPIARFGVWLDMERADMSPATRDRDGQT